MAEKNADMNDVSPPERLPAGFREIWAALREADEKAGSRQALAGQLGTSTHTIQRILVDGTVPRFPETRNARIVRAWVRIITRLALAFDREPRGWVEMVGIPWDDTAQAVSESVVSGGRRRRGAIEPGARMPGARDLAAGSPRQDGPAGLLPRAWPEHLTVGVAGRGVFSRHLDELGGSFLEVFVRRLVGAVNPSTRLRFQVSDEADVVSGMLERRPSFQLGSGIMDSVHRRYLGLVFLHIPGFEVSLNAICIRRKGEGRQPPTWQQATAAGNKKGRYFLVTAGGAAADFLTGQCGITPEEMLVRTAAAPGDIPDILLQETELYPEHWVIFVGESNLCTLVHEALHRMEGFSDAFAVGEVPGALEEGPRYPLGIAMRASASLGGLRGWIDLLRSARDDDLFRSSCRRTAHLYASLMIASFLDRYPTGAGEEAARRGVIELAVFEQATLEFKATFYRHLVLGLKEALIVRLGGPGAGGGGAIGFGPGIPQLGDSRSDGSESGGEISREQRDAIESRAAGRAAVYAELLMPREWLRSLEDVVVREQAAAYDQGAMAGGELGVGRSPSCHSCSASLLDEHNRGASDRYCRFCADEDGRLKPRDKVQNIIAGWFERWQEDLTHDDAMHRAGLFMLAMPAWCRN